MGPETASPAGPTVPAPTVPAPTVSGAEGRAGAGEAQGLTGAEGALVAPLAGDAGLGRVWTVPNALSLARLACVPVFLWLLLGARSTVAAASLLALLGATDWVDGWVARRLGQVSTVGKLLDPAADRALLAAGVIGALVAGDIPAWLFAVVVAREASVSAAVVALAARGSARIDVVWAGKAGTFALMFALPLFLFGHSTLSWHPVPEGWAWAFTVPGLALSWWAAASYVPRARRALSQGRVGSPG